MYLGLATGYIKPKYNYVVKIRSNRNPDCDIQYSCVAEDKWQALAEAQKRFQPPINSIIKVMEVGRC